MSSDESETSRTQRATEPMCRTYVVSDITVNRLSFKFAKLYFIGHSFNSNISKKGMNKHVSQLL